MGSGEYGGNGSVEWHVDNERDKDHGNVHHKHEGKDSFPSKADGGNFTVTVYDIPQNGFSWSAGVLTAELPIKHGVAFTRQIKLDWPNPPGVTPGMQAGRAKATRTKGRSAAAAPKPYTATARKK